MNRPAELRTAAIVAPSPVPLHLGGAERHWEGLRAALVARGIATDVVKLPVREHGLADLVDAYEQFALLDLSHVDLVVTGKYPAWMVQHPNHVVWMLHPLRGLYDTWNPAAHETVGGADPLRAVRDAAAFRSLLDRLERGPAEVGPFGVIDAVRAVADLLGPGADATGGPLAVPGPLARAVVHHLDRWALDGRRVARHAAISEVVAGRADYFPADVDVEVVRPPSCLDDPGDTGDPGDTFLAVSRLDRPKRVDLAIDAVRRLHDPGITLTVVGDGPDRARLERLAHGDPRIAFTGRVADDRLAALYRSARAVVVTPEDEDFGYVTVEAMQHGRAVITTTDSGGPAETVGDGVDGLVAEPTAAAISRAVARLWSEPDLAARLGDRGRATARAHDWPTAVERILRTPTRRPEHPKGRGRLVAVSSYPVLGWPGGGAERAGHLLGALQTHGWDVTVVCFTNQEPGPAGMTLSRQPGDGIEQVAVPPSARHQAAETRLRRLTDNVSITDVAASVLWPASPEFTRELRHALDGASGVVCVQPYLAPAVVALDGSVPLVYDAHNHERALKAQMLPDDEAGRWMLDRVAEAEGVASTRAALVVATTAEDCEALAADHGLDPAHLAVVPNGVDTTRVRFCGRQERAGARAELLEHFGAPPGVRGVALFVGSAHRPNIRAGRLLVEIAAELPDVLFVLAGRHSDELSPECPSNVRLAGQVSGEELDRLLAGADVALNPMLSGGGSNLKLLEYFAAGVPVVTTPLGARGLTRPSEVAVLARPWELRDRIVATLLHPDQARVQAARRLVEREYDWSRIGEQFTALVDRALRADPGSRPPGSTRANERPESP